MSKKTSILLFFSTLLFALVLIVVIAHFAFGVDFLKSGAAVTREIPKKRPERLDQKLIERFEGESMSDILATLQSEKEATPAETDQQARLVSGLPDAPLPFPAGTEPQDEAILKDVITTMQQGSVTDPTLLDRWRFNLALSGMGITTEEIPEAVRVDFPTMEDSDTFPITLARKENDLIGPIAVGNFDDKPGLEIISGGGARLSSIDSEGVIADLGAISDEAPVRQICPGDFDDDGDLDLFLVRGDGLPNSLLKSLGDGTFEDITIENGLLSFNDSTCAAWLDFDGDNRLDLLVGSNDHPLELYQQTSGGSFQPVAWDLSLWVYKGVRSIAVADYTGDGYPDFFLSIAGLPDRLCRNAPASNWQEWRFPEAAIDSQLTEAEAPATALFFDFDNDGDSDLVVGEVRDVTPAIASGAASSSVKGNAVRLYRNLGNGGFLDATADVDLSALTTASALGIVDLDNDGFEDLVVGTGALAIDRVFWNRGGVRFREVTAASRGGYLDGTEGFITGDLDGDGKSELLASTDNGNIRWLESDGFVGHWLRLDLTGTAVGASVDLVVRDRDWILRPISRTVAEVPQLTIGLGQAETIETLRVTAPGAEKPAKELADLEPDQVLKLELPKEPKKRAVVPLVPESENEPKS